MAATLPDSDRGGAGECHPSVDVLETDAAVEVLVDVAGVPPRALRVAFRANVLLIVGEKSAHPSATSRTFHLVEREFGRFARAVRLPGAFDVAAARAHVRDGELRITLPKQVDRRGQRHAVTITSGRDRTDA